MTARTQAAAAPLAGMPDATTPRQAASPFVVMVKPVGARCNLACGYCYYLNTRVSGVGAGRQASARMSDELLERFIRQYIEASGGPVVSFTWHGGEPALAGLDFYRRAVDIQRRYLPDGWSCWNSLQTNGTLLDDEWCTFLAAEKFDVGLSIDGTEWIHDTYRKDPAGRGSHGRAAAAIRRLTAHGVRPDLLCAVTADTAREPLSVYRALRAFGTGWVQFIPIVRRITPGGGDSRPSLDGAYGVPSADVTSADVTPDSVTADAYGDFLCAIFDEWAAYDLGRTDVQLFAETARVWAGGNAGLCWMAPTCGRALIVEADGGVYSCDHFVDAAHRIGDVYASHLGALADLPAQLKFGSDKRDLLPADCRACEWLPVCGGGCPKDRFARGGDGKGDGGGEPCRNYLCAGLRRFFAHARPTLAQIARQTADGQSPAAIMADIRARHMEQWKGVGRNDPCPCGSGKKAKNCCWNRYTA